MFANISSFYPKQTSRDEVPLFQLRNVFSISFNTILALIYFLHNIFVSKAKYSCTSLEKTDMHRVQVYIEINRRKSMNVDIKHLPDSYLKLFDAISLCAIMCCNP